jgi:hypothetical protein
MKKIFLLFSLFLTTNLLAQKIEINDAEEVIIDGKQIGKLEKMGEDESAIYTFYNLDDEELFSVHTSDDDVKTFVLTFLTSEDEAYFQATSNNTRSYIIKEVLKNKLIVNGQLNESKIKTYCSTHKPKVKKINPNLEKDEASSDDDLLDEVISKAKEKKELKNSEKEIDIESIEKEEATAQDVADLDPLDAVLIAAREQQQEQQKKKEEAERKKVKLENEAKAIAKDSNALVDLVLIGEKIYVDQRHVGYYKVFNITLEGEKSKNISLYNMEAKRIGIIKYKIGGNLAVMTTAKDGKQTDLGFSLTDEEDIKKDLITQAAELGYFK